MDAAGIDAFFKRHDIIKYLSVSIRGGMNKEILDKVSDEEIKYWDSKDVKDTAPVGSALALRFDVSQRSRLTSYLSECTSYICYH